MITASRKIKVQTARYEGVEISFLVTDIPDDSDPDEISRHLDTLFAPEIHRACEVASSNGMEDTGVYAWKDLIEQTTEGA